MAKIMLVEDDNNLREIYEARLLAEGYEIVSARDGEEALALAVKEKPDLIISDVMMPKISGFDMLDILRSTAETKETKVIMMTALSQAEDKARADKLGADRYLVKSQVTLEDVAKVARDVLAGPDGASQDTPTTTTVPVAASAPSTPPAAPATPVAVPVVESTPQIDNQAPAAPVAANPLVDTGVQQQSTPAAEPSLVSNPLQPANPFAQTQNSPPPESNPPSIETPNTTAEAATPAAPLASNTGPAASTSVPTTPVTTPGATGISDDLSQTTAAEEEAIESQINAIFAEPVQTDDTATNMESTPTAEQLQQAELDSVLHNQLETLDQQASQVQTIEVASAPPDDVATPSVNVSDAPQTPPVLEVPPVSATIADIAAHPEPQEDATHSSDGASVNNKKVIKPVSDLEKKPDINELLKQEQAKEAVTPPLATTVIAPGSTESTPGAQPTQTPPSNSSPTVSPNDITL